MAKNIPGKSLLVKLVHAGVVVKDIEKAVKCLEALQLGPAKPLSLPPQKGDFFFRGKPIKSQQEVSIVPAGEIELELFQPIRGESPWKEFLEKKGEGIHHIAFASDDIDRDVATMQGRGATVVHNGKW